MNDGLRRPFSMVAGVALCGLLGFTASLAWADEEHGHKAGGHGYGMERHGGGHHGARHHFLLHHLLRHQKDIGLTDEQVGKLKVLALDQDRAKIRAHADVMVAKRELKALVWDEKSDLSAIQAKLKERAALDANVQFMEVKGRRELLAVLTSEQRDKLKAVREQMRDSHRTRMSSREHEQAAHEEVAEGASFAPETEPYEGSGERQAG